jgi:subtilisin family serine protease
MKFSSITALIFVIGATPLWAATENYNGHEASAGRVLMKLRNPSSATLQQLRQLGDADDLRPLNGVLSIYVLHSRSANVAGLVKSLQNLPFVAYVEPDYVVKTTTTPNDPSFSQQWSLLNTTTPGADISATAGWGISTGSTANVIGVTDSGIDYTHPDLAGNVWGAPAQFSAILSWGTITCPAGSHGYNAIARSCDPADDHGHGTHVSGTIGAVGNNSLGVVGVNWTTRIMGLKFLNSAGSGNVSDAIDAIEFALQAKAQFAGTATPVNVRVFSASWGGGGFSQALLDEINKANTNDVLFVAAAGNSGANIDTSPSYPASYSATNLIAVAATTTTDALASFSNYGKSSVHLGAPGVSIISTLPGSAYGFLSGTSMATPHVSGAAMLVLSKCSLNTAALKNALLTTVDLVPGLSTLTISGGRLNVYKAISSCGVSFGPTGTASFVKTDTTTQGTWKGSYGGEGYNVINDSISYPAYVNVTPSGNASYLWGSTSDVRGMQKAFVNERIAACWYSSASFSIDLSFNDSNPHQVAFYMLDWDNYLGRTQRVDIVDANNTVLDTRSIGSFTGGIYLAWNLSGHVIIRITNTNPPSNAVLSGIFFGGGGGNAVPPTTGTASFVKTDTTTQGTWKGSYGAEGYNVINDSISYPAYVNVTPTGNASYVWGPTSDVRGMQKAFVNERIAACWYSSASVNIDLSFNDSNPHQVALYMLDWDNYLGRTQRVDILDTNNTVLDTRSVGAFTGGIYLAWNLSGHVIIRITNTNPPSNAVLSGIFFGGGGGNAVPPTTGTASFVKVDTSTQGTWKGSYGAEGYNIISDSVSYPPYVNVTPTGNASYVWGPTSDIRGMQKAFVNERIAACWYSSASFTIDLSFNDSNPHQVAFYMLDWDNYFGRSQRIDILDTNNTVLATRSISSFTGGLYMVWNLSGHVIVRIANTNTLSNAVLSGILFR